MKTLPIRTAEVLTSKDFLHTNRPHPPDSSLVFITVFQNGQISVTVIIGAQIGIVVPVVVRVIIRVIVGIVVGVILSLLLVIVLLQIAVYGPTTSQC